MQVSNWVVFGVAELIGVLLLICIFLGMHARTLKSLIAKLQSKLHSLAKELKSTKRAYQEMEASIPEPLSYADLLDEQLDGTRQYHLTLDPDQDIVLDLSSTVPLPRQLTSLRHAFLLSEKEAALSSQQPAEPNWNVLHSKLSNLIQFFKSDSNDSDESQLQQLQQALASSQQRVDNLEQFKTLFFELENQWHAAQQQADDYQQQIDQAATSSSDTEHLNELLNGYRESFSGIDQIIQAGTNSHGTTLTQVVDRDSKPAPVSDELAHLQSVTANQHRLINELQQRLSVAYSAADKAAIINDLQAQLDTQLQYMSESETCIKLMETELDDAHAKITQLESRQASQAPAAKTDSINPELKKAFHVLKEEREMMNKTILNLQQENEQLAMQMDASLNEHSNNNANTATEQELQQLQLQYTELESKYLALRMKG